MQVAPPRWLWSFGPRAEVQDLLGFEQRGMFGLEAQPAELRQATNEAQAQDLRAEGQRKTYRIRAAGTPEPTPLRRDDAASARAWGE